MIYSAAFVVCLNISKRKTEMSPMSYSSISYVTQPEK